MLNKKGFALPIVLGTFVFITSLTAGLFILVMNTTLLIARDIEVSNDDFTGRNNLTVFFDVVENEGKVNEAWLELLSLEKEIISNTITRIYYTRINGKEFEGYVIFSGTEFDSIPPDAEIIAPGVSPGTNPTFNVDTLIESDLVVQTGNNLTVAEGSTLFIDGDFIIDTSSRFTVDGLIIVRGNLIIIRWSSGQNAITINGEIRVYGSLINDDEVGIINPQNIIFLDEEEESERVVEVIRN